MIDVEDGDNGPASLNRSRLDAPPAPTPMPSRAHRDLGEAAKSGLRLIFLCHGLRHLSALAAISRLLHLHLLRLPRRRRLRFRRTQLIR